jgi:putative membrane protein insertion efficiency factor
VPKAITALIAAVLLAALAVYRRILSPVFYALGARCRFYPTCSTYAVECVRHYGPWRGSWRALKRLGRCHPYHPGGFDPPIPSDTMNG